MLSDAGGLSYGQYLKLDKILDAQTLQSDLDGEHVHDEHLFIVTHQTYELWFKQILYEVDSVREIFMGALKLKPNEEQNMTNGSTESSTEKLTLGKESRVGPKYREVDESRMLEIMNRMNRVVMILKLLVDQVMILETMTPLNFMDFRDYLTSASGFQSLQFRLLENRLGVKPENRVKYNQSNYRNIFKDIPDEYKNLQASEGEASLSECIQKWLERTPGLEENGFNFPEKFERVVDQIFHAEMDEVEKEENEAQRLYKMSQLKKKKVMFDSLFDREVHDSLLARGE